MMLATLQLRGNKDYNGQQEQRFIEMGVTIFKTFIWVGIHRRIYRLKSRVTASLMHHRLTLNYLSDHVSNDTSPNENFEYSYPLNAYSAIVS